MNDLIERISKKAGITDNAAKEAVSAIISYLDSNVPENKMAPLYAAVPGAQALVVKPKGGLFGSVMGGIMAVYAKLAASGLSTGQMKAAGEELLAVAREKAGDAAVDDVVDSVPSLRQLL